MDQRIRKILENAIMAPSGDNCQPWQFAIDGLKVELYNDPRRDTSLYNLKQRASLIAHGAFLENIKVVSSSVGLAAEIQFSPDDEDENHIASISFTETSEQVSPLYQAIPIRHTNRERYLPAVVSAEKCELWQRLTGCESESVWVCWQKEQMATFVKLLSYNDRLVFEVQDLHRFLFEQIRWTDQEARKTGDGLDIKTLGLNLVDRSSFSLLKKWGFVAFLNKIGFSSIIQLKAKQLLNSSSAFAVLTISSDTVDDYVRGGMLWQRLLLQLASEGLTVQPIAGLAFLVQSAKEGLLADKLTQEQLRNLQRIRRELIRLSGCNDEKIVLAMFRIGSGPQVTRALRRPLESFLCEKRPS